MDKKIDAMLKTQKLQDEKVVAEVKSINNIQS